MVNPTPQTPNAKCQECGVDFRVPPSRVHEVKFCSWACRSARPRLNRPQERVRWECRHCGKRKQLRPYDAANQQFCTKKCHAAWLVATGNPRRNGEERPCKNCGTPIYVVPSLADRKRYCSKDCANADKPMPARFKVSRISQEIADLFESRNPGLPIERELRIGRWSIDMALTDLRVAIEIDGIYWHSLPGIAEKDARKDSHLRDHGWTVLRFPVEREPAAEIVARIERRLATTLSGEGQATHEWNPTQSRVQ